MIVGKPLHTALGTFLPCELASCLPVGVPLPTDQVIKVYWWMVQAKKKNHEHMDSFGGTQRFVVKQFVLHCSSAAIELPSLVLVDVWCLDIGTIVVWLCKTTLL